jgi:hypothetical protein
MTRADIPGLMAIAAVVHSSYPENEAVFAERLSLFPVGCRRLWAWMGGCTDMSSVTLGEMRRQSH